MSRLMQKPPPFASFDFNERPFVVIWEVTRACALACRHCRAEAQGRPDPRQLSTTEGFALIEQVRRANPGIFILTGGDPVMRRDLPDLVRHATALGLQTSLSPSATPRLLNTDFKLLRHCGVNRISLSLDGATKEEHDRFRGVPGTWDWTMRAIEKAREAELPFQINTTITAGNIRQFDQFRDLLTTLKPVLWSVFLLVPTGRALLADLPQAEEMECFLQQLQRFSKTAPFDIKTTEGPFYRRILVQNSEGVVPTFSRRAPPGVNDGKGFVFISHTGDVQPSGFLPHTAGNVRTGELRDIYQNSPIFQQLRDPDALTGKCGRCEFRTLCGGSRARAYALTGDFMGEDPLCLYQPTSETAFPMRGVKPAALNDERKERCAECTDACLSAAGVN